MKHPDASPRQRTAQATKHAVQPSPRSCLPVSTSREHYRDSEQGRKPWAMAHWKQGTFAMPATDSSDASGTVQPIPRHPCTQVLCTALMSRHRLGHRVQGTSHKRKRGMHSTAWNLAIGLPRLGKGLMGTSSSNRTPATPKRGLDNTTTPQSHGAITSLYLLPIPMGQSAGAPLTGSRQHEWAR